MPEGLKLKLVSELPEFRSVLPAILAGVFGVGMLEMSHADVSQADWNQSASEPSSHSGGMDRIASQERKRLEELLRSRGMQRGSYPPFSVAVKGQQVTIKFQIPPTCELSHLIVGLVSRLGLKAEEQGGGSKMIMRAWDSSEEFDALVNALKLAGGKSDAKKALERRPRAYQDRRNNKPNTGLPSSEKPLSALEAMGVRIFGLDESYGAPTDGVVSWDNIAGYDEQKRYV
ncbi:hypothetical protein ACLOJK_039371 [Asimina triloba]